MTESRKVLDLASIINIIRSFSEKEGPLYLTDITSEPESEYGQRAAYTMEELRNTSVVETDYFKMSTGEVMGITALLPPGQKLLDLLSNEQVLASVQKTLGENVDLSLIGSVIELATKLSGGILKRDPEKKKAKEAQKEEKREVRQEKRRVKLHQSMPVKEAKQRLIDYSRTCIPEHLIGLVRVPGTSTSNQLYLTSTKAGQVLDFLENHYSKKRISERIDKNNRLPGLEVVELFELSSAGGSELSGESMDRYLEDEENKVRNNINIILTNPDSEINQFINAFNDHRKKESFIGNESVDDILSEQDDQLKTAKAETIAQTVVDLGNDVLKNNDPELIPDDEDNEKDSNQETEDAQGQPALEKINNPLQLATLNSDSAHKGQDLLGFKQDVEAFAAIMALKKLTPPLAIALFGQWGTGKSFFMQKLVEKVDELGKKQGVLRKKQRQAGTSPAADSAPFCEGVCQIQFNAWSYTDTNLWASLVSGIFQGLESYITKNKREEIEKEAIESELSKELDLSKEQEAKLSLLKDEKKKEVQALTHQRNRRQHLEAAAIKRVKGATMDQVLSQLKQNFQDSETLAGVKQGLEDLQVSTDEMTNWSPQNLLDEVTAWKTFALDFFRISKKQWRLVAIGTILILGVALLPVFYNPEWNLQGLSFLGISGSALVAIWEKARKTLSRINPVINQVANYKNAYDEKMAELVSQQEQRVEAAKLKITKSRQEITQIDERLHSVRKEISKLEYSLKHTLSQKALYSFILQRSQSNDYERHLGIISTIRRDFETLSYLFVESLAELKQLEEDVKKEDLHQDEKDEIDEKIKSLAPYRKFSDQFDQPLERIILYIDDLDRCPEERVVEVLEAVNLLMAFPLFVVVVGVDPRWVKNALIKKYYLQFTGKMAGVDKDVEEIGVEVINASDYLEKIFQIPFHLMSPSDNSIKGMIAHLLGDAVEETAEGQDQHQGGDETDKQEGAEQADGEAGDDEKEEDDDAAEREQEEDGDKVVLMNDGASGAVADQDEAGGEEDGDGGETDDENDGAERDDQDTEGGDKDDTDSDQESRITPGSLKIHRVEGEYMQKLSELIGNTPRTVKRFVNMYRIIRAHEGLSYTGDKDRKDLFGILFLLALRTGPFRDYFDEVLEWLFSDQSRDIAGILRDRIDHLGPEFDSEELRLLYVLLEIEDLPLLRSIDADDMLEHITFVKRFSFKIPE